MTKQINDRTKAKVLDDTKSYIDQLIVENTKMLDEELRLNINKETTRLTTENKTLEVVKTRIKDLEDHYYDSWTKV